MNPIKPLRRLTPLAIIFVALAAVLALTPSAHAQSSTGQLEPIGLAPGHAAQAKAPFIGVEVDNPANPAQHWIRMSLPNNTYKFSRKDVLSCIRVPANVPSSQNSPVELGTCGDPRAAWRRVVVPGTGDAYVNFATGHYLSPPICFTTCDNRVYAINTSTANALGLPLLRWYFDVL